jgi:dihydroxyacetone kinase-like predicted kinase
MSTKFVLEFVLHAKDSSPKIIKSALAEFGSDLVVGDCQKQGESCNYKVSMTTEDPTLVFDLCSQLGRIRSVKVHESCKL